ncbi:MAG: OB-fold nucleic acid binding domain-containing protein [Nanoarchaeota archaeon]
MNEKTLLKISLAATILGLAFLFFYAGQFDLRALEKVNLPEEKVQLQGRIKSLQMKDKVAFMVVEGERVETTPVVIFPPEELFLNVGDYVEIVGTVEEYQGKKEVVASSVVLK